MNLKSKPVGKLINLKVSIPSVRSLSHPLTLPAYSLLLTTYSLELTVSILPTHYCLLLTS